jgi:SAM-dependent methyltransferase
VNFDRITELYEGKLGGDAEQQEARRRIHWVCAQAAEREVLDIGCSQGIASVLLAREGKTVVGLDREIGAIDFASERRLAEEEAVQARLTFTLGEAFSLPFPDGSFDSVLMGEVLEHQIDRHRPLEEAHRVLRVGAELVITVPYGLFPFHDHKEPTYIEPLLKSLTATYFDVQQLTLLDRHVGIVAHATSPTECRPALIWPEAFHLAERRLAAQDRVVDDQRKRISRLEADSKTLRGHRQEKNRLEARLAELESEQGTLSTTSAQLHETVGLAREEASALKAERSALTEQLAQAQAQLEAERAAGSERIQGLEDERRKLVGTVARTEEGRRALTEQLAQAQAQLEAERAAGSERIQGLEDERRKLVETAARTEEGRQALTEQLAQAEEQLAREEKRLQAEVSAAELKAEQASETAQAASRLQARTKHLERELKQVRARVASQDRQVQVLAEIRASRSYSLMRALWAVNQFLRHPFRSSGGRAENSVRSLGYDDGRTERTGGERDDSPTVSTTEVEHPGAASKPTNRAHIADSALGHDELSEPTSGPEREEGAPGRRSSGDQQPTERSVSRNVQQRSSELTSETAQDKNARGHRPVASMRSHNGEEATPAGDAAQGRAKSPGGQTLEARGGKGPGRRERVPTTKQRYTALDKERDRRAFLAGLEERDYLLGSTLGGQLRVAGILDETLRAPVGRCCELISFRPDNWSYIVEAMPPDVLLVESAWRGNGGSWQYKIAEVTHPDADGLEAVVDWCREHDIPSVFWYTDDARRVPSFARAAKQFDLLCAADPLSCRRLAAMTDGREVHLLPLAAQPKSPNAPLGIGREVSVAFIGGYPTNASAGGQHPQKQQLEALLDAALPYGLQIYETGRSPREAQAQTSTFPERYHDALTPLSQYGDLEDLLRHCKVVLCAEYESRVPTLVFEALATGATVVAVAHSEMDDLLGEQALVVSGKAEADALLARLLTSEEYRRRHAHGAQQAVLAAHTYQVRLAQIACAAGLGGCSWSLPGSARTARRSTDASR